MLQMPLPQTRLPAVASNTGLEEPHKGGGGIQGAGQQAGNEPAAGEEAMPAWQNYFYMAPNVRFTRTPDAQARKPATEEAAVQPAVAVPTQPVTHTPARPASAAPVPVAPQPRPVAPVQHQP